MQQAHFQSTFKKHVIQRLEKHLQSESIFAQFELAFYNVDNDLHLEALPCGLFCAFEEIQSMDINRAAR